MATLEITTVIGCPLMCTFCPQDALQHAYPKGANRRLAIEDFRKVLERIPRHVRVDFSGMSEPWANADATEMLELAVESGFAVAIYTTLAGMTLDDAKRVIRLIREHPDRIGPVVLHLPDANGNMRGWRQSDEYKAVLAQFLDLRRSSPEFGRIVSVMTMDGTGRFHPELGDVGVRLPAWRGISRAGNLDTAQVAEIGARPMARNEAAVSCSMTPFYDHNVLLPNGDVFLCCMDYSLKHRIGNLLEQSYEDLFLSPELASLRVENAKPGFSKCSLCKSCESVVTYQPKGATWVADASALGVRTVIKQYLLPSVRRALKDRTRSKN